MRAQLILMVDVACITLAVGGVAIGNDSAFLFGAGYAGGKVAGYCGLSWPWAIAVYCGSLTALVMLKPWR